MTKTTKVKTFFGYIALIDLEKDLNNFCKDKNIKSIQYHYNYQYTAMVVYEVTTH